MEKSKSKEIKGTRAVTIDVVPTNDQLREILQYGDIKARALFLVLSSSGMRIGEALKLRPEDIDMSKTPTKIHLRAEITKTGNSRITFISEEATEALKLWLKNRERYIENAVKKTNFKNRKSPDSPYVFPFSYQVAQTIWKNLIEKAGYNEKDPSTNRYKMHIHTLRKYFRTRMSLKIPADVVEALMGHEGYLTHVYRRYGEHELAEMYLKAEQQIVIIKLPLDVIEIEKNLTKLRSENLKLRRDLDRVMDILVNETRSRIDEKENTIQKVIFSKEERRFIPIGEKMNYKEWKREEERAFREKYTKR